MTPPRTAGAAAKQHGLLLVKFESAALHRKLQHLEGGAFQVKELAAFLAHEVHLFFALAWTRLAVAQLVVVVGTDNLYDAGLFHTGQVPVYSTQ